MRLGELSVDIDGTPRDYWEVGGLGAQAGLQVGQPVRCEPGNPATACLNYHYVVVMEITSSRGLGSGAVQSRAAGL